MDAPPGKNGYKDMKVKAEMTTAVSSENPHASEKEFDRKITVPNKPVYGFFKRLLDIIGSFTGLVVLFVPLLIVALIVVIDSPGASPIYVQERVGKNGRRFRFYKLRSMVPDADSMLDSLLDKNEMDGPVFKMKDDPRITRFGRLLRRTSIDELPQLWNVLKGDLSLVGPRPALPREVERYTDYHRQRLLVRPGLTCYWQIQPRRNSLSFEEWISLDLKYICERSFWRDLKLLFKTVGAVIGQEGE